MTERYQHIVFMRGGDADNALHILFEHVPGSIVWRGPYQETIEDTVAYLAEWDTGEGAAEISDRPAAGRADNTARVGDYLLTWNLSLGYVGLERVLQNAGPEEDAVDEEFLRAFTDAYIRTGLWCDLYDEDGDQVRQEDAPDADEAITGESLAALEADCERFAATALREMPGNLDLDADKCGSDFWLTRNGHGDGFWAGGYPEPVAARLTALAEEYAPVQFEINEDSVEYLPG